MRPRFDSRLSLLTQQFGLLRVSFLRLADCMDHSRVWLTAWIIPAFASADLVFSLFTLSCRLF